MRSRRTKTSLSSFSVEGEVEKMKEALVKSKCPAKTIGKILNIKIDARLLPQAHADSKENIPSKNSDSKEGGDGFERVFLTEDMEFYDNNLSSTKDQNNQKSSKERKRQVKISDEIIRPTPFEIALQKSQSTLHFDYIDVGDEILVQPFSSNHRSPNIAKEIKTHYRHKRLKSFRDALNKALSEGKLQQNHLIDAYIRATSAGENTASRLHSKNLESTECMGDHLKQNERIRKGKIKRSINQKYLVRYPSDVASNSGCEQLGQLAGMLSRRHNEDAIAERDTCAQKQRKKTAAQIHAQRIQSEEQARVRYLQGIEQKRQDAFNMRISLARDLLASQVGIPRDELSEIIHNYRDHG